MKKLIGLVILHFLCRSLATAQVNRAIIPVSFYFGETALPAPVEIELPDFNLAEAERLDKEDAKNNKVPVFARAIYTNITLDNSGNWSELPNGDRIWRLRVTSQGAEALIPYYNLFYLPQGSTLHVYTPERDEVIGAFTPANNPADGLYCTGLIHGETCILEYYEPKEVQGQGKISINAIGHAYRMVSDYFPRSTSATQQLGFGNAEGCEVNVNCSEGDNWQNQKRAVVCILIQDASGQERLCSGTMINNVNQDCTPYLLSAQHCGEESQSPVFSQWVFYFNFESPTCSNPTSQGTLADEFITGCNKVADSNDDGGTTGSDFLLLHLNVAPPSFYNVYYAGWNNTDTASLSGVCIHHPEGDIKKISTYTSPVVSSSYGAVSNTHWQVTWVPTTNGWGVTEPGSSGSPLINNEGLVVGHLSGGLSACGAPSDTSPDYFGKIHYDWTSDGTIRTEQLQPWLDPDNTGVTSLEGQNATCATAVTNVPLTALRFNILPNPSTGLVHVIFNDAGERTIYIYDITGRKISEITSAEKTVTLDLSSENKGIYLLEADALAGNSVQKLVIQ